jgi:choline dehydrogenase-like flavoprotein
LRGDIFHPGGSTRMGVNARAGVVDRDLRVFAASNLSIASAATFPTGASANPTLTIMCLALRLGDRLARELSTGR